MTSNELASHYIDTVRRQLAQGKMMADRALAQVDDGAFFRALDEETNTLAVQVKHVAGNLRSRFLDFLTSDGEKDDRHRDREFETEGESREGLMAAWEEGWGLLFGALDDLGPDDLGRTITIRQEPHTVIEALERNLGHTAYHMGQIVQLAKHWAGDGWQVLTIPRGGTEAYNESMRRKAAERKAAGA